MRKEILDFLRPITEEEQRVLEGKKDVQRGIYTSRKHFTVESAKLLQQGKLITVRPHTRFVHFPTSWTQLYSSILCMSGFCNACDQSVGTGDSAAG